jgi:hypothetical protein
MAKHHIKEQIEKVTKAKLEMRRAIGAFYDGLAVVDRAHI